MSKGWSIIHCHVILCGGTHQPLFTGTRVGIGLVSGAFVADGTAVLIGVVVGTAGKRLGVLDITSSIAKLSKTVLYPFEEAIYTGEQFAVHPV